MVMGLLGRRAVASGPVLAFLVLATGCAAPHTIGLGRWEFPTCPGFQLNTQPIEITPEARTIPLGGGNSLVVPSRAVSRAGSYAIGYVHHNGQKVAGVKIDPMSGAQSKFDEAIELQISYAACPRLIEAEDQPFHVIKKDKPGQPNLGGGKSTSRDLVRVLIDSLTEFAIAI